MFKKIVFHAMLILSGSVAISQNIGDEYPNALKTIERGVTLYDEGNYQESVEAYKKINPCDSNYFLAVYEMALAYIELKEYDKAITNCKIGLALNSPEKRGFYDLIGSAYDYLEKPDSALYYYSIGMREFPYYHKYYYETAITYMNKKDDKLAYENFVKSAQLNPFHAGTHLGLARLAARNGYFTASMLAYEYFLLLENKTNRGFNALGELEKLCNNNYELAESKFDITTDGNRYPEMDEIIKSRAAQISSYKCKVKLPYTDVIKQCQILSEKFKFDPSDKGYYNQFYGAFFNSVWKKDYFEASMYAIFSGINNDDVQKQVKKHESKIKSFTDYSIEFLQDYRKNIKHVINNKEIDGQRYFYNSGVIESVGNRDSKNIKSGKWYIYYNNGYLNSEGNYLNDQPDGKWFGYYDTGKLKNEVNWSNGKRNGVYIVYYENGNMKEKGNYANNLLDGEIISYYSNGAVKDISVYKNDVITGDYIYNNTQGIKSASAVYVESKLNGPVVNYYNTGSPSEERVFKNGKCIGHSKSYYISGELYSEGNYENNDRSGTWTWYYKNGKKSKEGTYKDGKIINTWTEYYSDGKVSEIINYNSKGELDGEYKLYTRKGQLYMDGVFKSDKMSSIKYIDNTNKVVYSKNNNSEDFELKRYYSTGQLEEEGQMKNKKRDGVFYKYYACGKKYSEENYSNGDLSGSYKTYHRNGQIKEQYMCVKNEYHGYYRKYYSDGTLQEEGYYSNGNFNGPITKYYKNGTLKEQYYYINGEAVGYELEYDAKGKLANKYVYSDIITTKQEAYDTLGKIIQTLDFKNGTGTFTLNNLINTPKMTYEMTFGKKNSQQTEYFSTGKIKKTSHYKSGDLVDKVSSYYFNGKLKYESNYVLGSEEGEEKWYTEDGNIDCIENFKNDELDGKTTWYHSNGNLFIERFYNEGDRDSSYSCYAEDGKTLAIRLFYNNNIITGYTYLDKAGNLLPVKEIANETATITTTYPNGSKAYEVTLNNGQVQGVRKSYSLAGKVMYETTFADDNYDGPVKEYYLSGKLKSVLLYKNGDLNGTGYTYYENGNVKSECQYINNVKYGAEKKYDQTGKLLNTYLNVNDETYIK